MAYTDFLDGKRHRGAACGFSPDRLPAGLFDFQEALTTWALERGRAAIFADCGLGKTAMQLAWADCVARKTDKPVLVLTPLAVGAQTVAEGEKFGIECHRSRDGSVRGRITVTNYEILSAFNPDDFAGIVCDESSILKNFDGVRRGEVTNFMRKMPYRLLTTATAAPNDYTELGTSSEALGFLGHMDMLAKFFVNDNNNSASKRMYGEAPEWRFKGHAETPFWRWVTSWARACRKPSDLGFDDRTMTLPPLVENVHLVEAAKKAPGYLFSLPARSLAEQRDEKKRSTAERCAKVRDIVTAEPNEPFLVWCHSNDEAAELVKMLGGCAEVSGADSDDEKEAKFLAFIRGDERVLVTKPKIGAWGLNFQHCARITFFPSHSYEQYYQAVRRCWRFGQQRPVQVDVVMTEGERRVMDNMRAKAEKAESMFRNLVTEMHNALGHIRTEEHTKKQEIPQWL